MSNLTYYIGNKMSTGYGTKDIVTIIVTILLFVFMVWLFFAAATGRIQRNENSFEDYTRYKARFVQRMLTAVLEIKKHD